MRKILIIAGTRPNFVKIAPLLRAFAPYRRAARCVFVHTGQHYDECMSEFFFKDLDIVKPDIFLGVGSASHAEQTARIMIRFEAVVLKEKPDLIMVVGDVNSTLACALVGAKLHVPTAHVESGLRSFDRTMPEEINRIVTDRLSDFLFTSCTEANQNLKREGVSTKKIFFVGNIMIDALRMVYPRILCSNVLTALKVLPKKYAVVTLHRPSNVDNKKALTLIFSALKRISQDIRLVFPVHPRTKHYLEKFSLQPEGAAITMIEPLGYIDFLKLYSEALFVVTDSGGVQEETTYLKIPCLTIRQNTERPVTVRLGTNTLIGINAQRLVGESMAILRGRGKIGRVPPLWDGRTAERIVRIVLNNFG